MKKRIFFLYITFFNLSYTVQEPMNIRGLNNLGNTCYLNATIQCLLSIKSFRHACLSYNDHEDTSENDATRKFTQALCGFVHEYTTPDESAVSPRNFLTALDTLNIMDSTAFRQHDAHEFFVKLINQVSPKTGLRNLFKITYTFNKQYADIVKNEEQEQVNIPIQFDYIPSKKRNPEHRPYGSAIETLLKSFFCTPKTMMVSGKNSQEVEGDYLLIEKNLLNNSSDILCVTAPRTDYYCKHKIPFWTLGHQFFLYKKNTDHTRDWYSIVGAVVHRGFSMNNGHYAAVVRRGHQWYFCDDSSIQPVNHVGPILQGETGYDSYLFFFERAKNHSFLEKNFLEDSVNHASSSSLPARTVVSADSDTDSNYHSDGYNPAYLHDIDDIHAHNALCDDID